MSDMDTTQPQAVSEAPRPAKPAVRPSAWWYTLVAGLLVASIAIGVWGPVSMVFRIASDIRSITRVVMPGEETIALAKGSYVISHETKSMIGGRRFHRTSELGDVTCRVTNEASGEGVAIEPLTGSLHYTMGNYEGEGLWRFDAPENGHYVLAARAVGDAARAEEFVLAVGPPFPWRGLILGIVAVSIACMLFLGAVVLFLVVIIQRGVRKSRLAAQPEGA
ncbi:MAG: hypothetical protein ACYS8X_05235 [Planctomycetota bacterium]|jgi:hypothetical protein